MIPIQKQIDPSVNKLLRELHTRFPEVPVDVIYRIMKMNACNRERCIEMLARECQKYQPDQYANEGTQNSAIYVDNYLHQRSNSNDSRGSISSIGSGHSAGTPGGLLLMHETCPVSGDMQSSMRGSLSFPYLPPTDHRIVGHNPAPRSSLPLSQSQSEYVPPGCGGFSRIPEDSTSTSATFFRNNPFSGNTPNLFGRPNPETGLSPSSVSVLSQLNRAQFQQPPFSNQKSITSEVNYVVGGMGEPASRAQAVYAPKQSYTSQTFVNVFPPTGQANDHTSPLANQQHQSPARPTTEGMSNLTVNTSSASSRSPSVLQINPLQAWVTTPQRPTTYVSSISSSCESLPTAIMPGDPQRRSLGDGASGDPARFNGNTSRPGSGSGAPGEDISYIDALRVCQTCNLENLRRKYQDRSRYLQDLCAHVGQLESRLRARQYERSLAFPTAEDVQKLRNDNVQLRLDIQALTSEIDLANNGEMPLGELDPTLYRRDSMRRRDQSRVVSQSSVSSNPSVMSPAMSADPPPYCQVSLMPLPVPPCQADPGTQDETEDDWSCSACTFINNAALRNCEMCEMPRIPSSQR